MTDETTSKIEKILVIGVFGALAIFSMQKGNFEAAVGFATALSTYAMSRQGV